MKKQLGFGLLTTILLLSLVQACKKDYAPIGDPYTALEGINGSWKLNKVVQIDEASPLKDSRELSSFYGIGSSDSLMQIQFDASALTYRMDAGKGKNFLAPGYNKTLDSARMRGSWTFINETNPEFASEAPKGIQMINDLGDTVKVELLSPIRSFDQELGIKVVRCKLSYSYYFQRQN